MNYESIVVIKLTGLDCFNSYNTSISRSRLFICIYNGRLEITQYFIISTKCNVIQLIYHRQSVVIHHK